MQAAWGKTVLLTDPDMHREIDYDDLDRVTAVRRFVPPNATTPTHVETYVYNALGGFSVYDGVAMDDRRARLDGSGTASAGVSASLNGEPVPLDGGGRVTALQGQTVELRKARKYERGRQVALRRGRAAARRRFCRATR